MAESCSSCGKALSFRDNFEWKGKKICKSCLKSYKGVEEPSEPKEKIEEKKKGKKEELSWEKMNKDIKQWGIALIVLGVIHLLASEFLDASWGVVIIILGIVNLLVRKKEMFIANGIALIVVGIMNIGTGIEGGGRWAVFGIMQLVWGGQEIHKYMKYKKLSELKPGVPEEGKDVTDAPVSPKSISTAAPVSYEPIPADFSSIHDYKMLFDKDRLGINYYLGGALLIGFTLANFVWQIPGAIFQGDRIRFFMTVPLILFNIISAAAFLFVHYKFFTNLKKLALINGGFTAVIDLVQEIVTYQEIHRIDPNFTFQFERVFIGFIWGFLFVYILAETIKRNGIDLKALIAGMIVMQFAGNIIANIIYAIAGHGFNFHWYRLISVALNGAMYGVLIYYGFVLHLKKNMNPQHQL